MESSESELLGIVEAGLFKAVRESSGHVTDDVTWPQEIKIIAPKCSRLHVSTTVLRAR